MTAFERYSKASLCLLLLGGLMTGCATGYKPNVEPGNDSGPGMRRQCG